MNNNIISTEDNQEQKDKILLVDDNIINLQVLRDTLDGLGYKLLIAKSGHSALTIAQKTTPSLILLDIMMPEMDGYEVCRILKANEKTSNIPVIFVTAMSDVGNETKGLNLGAVDYITKPINPELVRARVRNHMELTRYRDHLERLVEERTRELALTQAITIDSLATLAEYRDPETGGHIKRTQNYVRALAMHLRGHPRFQNELDNESIELLYLSSPLHDIGKIGVQDNILLKAGRLTNEEFEEMRKHTIYGHDALHITEQKLGENSFLGCAKEIAYTHQEKWDGSGYPQRLKGEKIPLSGRLMALADVYDALISKRVYKPPLPHEEAVNMIKEGRGTHFDPDIVDAFLELKDTFRNIALTYADFDDERKMLTATEGLESEAYKSIENILLVEDNEISLEIMLSQLTSLGYNVDTAANGQPALFKYKQTTYDLILTDLEMPEMDGYALAAKIRRLEKGSGRSTLIIAVTASDYDLTDEGIKSLGFDGYMLKPLDVKVFQLKLASIVYNESQKLK